MVNFYTFLLFLPLLQYFALLEGVDDDKFFSLLPEELILALNQS